MKDNYRVVIAEDHNIVREGLKALLASEPGLEVCGEAVDGREAVHRVQELSPDLILMDLTMPRMNGLEAIGEIKKSCPNTKVLILTVHKTEEHVFASLQAGAQGYVLKDATSAELLLAIRSVLDGNTYLSPEISGRVVEGYLGGRKTQPATSAWDTLTDRERQILKMIAEGHKNKEIGEYFCISAKTVEKHRANLMKKLNLHNASALTAYAIEKGLITR